MFEALHGVKDKIELQIIVNLQAQPCNNSLWGSAGSEKSQCGLDVSDSIRCSSSGEFLLRRTEYSFYMLVPASLLLFIVYSYMAMEIFVLPLHNLHPYNSSL